MSRPASSFKTFMTKILDYAGIYPPANLPLDEAFENFREYQSSPDAWMLSHFVVPAKRLTELPEFDEILTFTALGRGGKEMDEFLENVNLDIADILAFRESRVASAAVDMFEVALPATALSDKFTANECVTRAADALNKNGITVYFEAPFGESWEDRAEKLLRALRKVKDKHVGFKLRTGGVTPEAFPTPGQVAWAIVEAREAGIPMKCTAGLHHPMRHYNQSVKAKMHGFINVFGAAVLASANRLTQEQIQPVIEDEDPANFIFNESGFTWKNLHAASSEIMKMRLFATSFGSCSFDEPLEDLRALNLL
jgi:hypothetical protein